MKRTPILVIYFNRPRYLEILLLALKKFEPKDIYFSCDGPRIDNSSDSINIKKCNEIIEKIVDWDCKKRFLHSKKNLGCDEWVPKSISWFFGQEIMGIILEDDCIIDDGFYNFASELLEKYANNPEIMNISASSFHKETSRDSADYHFSCYPLTWGWATWRRAWVHYQNIVNKQTYNDEIKGWLILNGFSSEEVKYWNKFFSRLELDTVAFWDAKWIYSIWLKKAYSITPNVNLVKNIGSGEDATHTKSVYDIPNLNINKLSPPLSHPSLGAIEVARDRVTFIVKFKFTLKKKLLYILRILFGVH